MLSTTSLSSRARFFLEELKTELTFPSLEGHNIKSSIAISNENSERFGNLWEKHGQLIIDAAIATSQSTIWYIKSNDECIYFDHKPTTELKEYLKEPPTRRTRYVTLQEKSKEYGIESAECKCLLDSDSSLLSLFWDNNKRFLLALMNGLPEKERKKIECLTAEVSKRDNTKYRVYFGTGQDSDLNKKWLSKDKGANNSETAWLIIKAWAELGQTNKTLKELNDAFQPKSCNEYYNRNKIFNNLFYRYNEKGEYKGDKGTDYENVPIVAGGWDFYAPKDENDKKFRIQLKDGEAIMLKVWRKSDLHKLMNHVKKYFTKGELSIQPDR
jgi:hypothetical protein